MSTTIDNAGLTEIDITNLYIISTTWCPNVVTVVITPSVLVDQTHDISMVTATIYTIPVFTLD
jgi:hypothetical protein